MAKYKFFRFWFPVLIYSGIIFYASSLPQGRVPLHGLRIDKLLHFLEFLPFGILLARALNKTGCALSAAGLVFVVMIVSLLYGLSDEFHQSFVPGRDVSVFDALADTIGGLAGAIIYQKIIKNQKTARD